MRVSATLFQGSISTHVNELKFCRKSDIMTSTELPEDVGGQAGVFTGLFTFYLDQVFVLGLLLFKSLKSKGW